MNRIFYMTTFIGLLAIAVFSTVIITDATARGDERTANQKSYFSYEIQSGDTLTSIAKEYTKETNISLNDYIDEVIENNQLSGEKITTGKKIIIAKYSYE